MATVPNQNVIIIHREAPQRDFLQIKNENWTNFLINSKNDYPALALYLYLASNMNGYKLALSPVAINNAIGMARSTYYKKIQLLKDLGYIIEKQGNILEFYETPQQKNNVSGSLPEKQNNLPEKQESLFEKQNCLPERHTCFSQKQKCLQHNIEIDNTYITDKKDKTNNDIQSQKQRKVEFIF